MIIDLALREKVSKLEYKELEKSFTEEFGVHAKDILSILFIHNMDSDRVRYVCTTGHIIPNTLS